MLSGLQGSLHIRAQSTFNLGLLRGCEPETLLKSPPVHGKSPWRSSGWTSRCRGTWLAPKLNALQPFPRFPLDSSSSSNVIRSKMLNVIRVAVSLLPQIYHIMLHVLQHIVARTLQIRDSEPLQLSNDSSSSSKIIRVAVIKDLSHACCRFEIWNHCNCRIYCTTICGNVAMWWWTTPTVVSAPHIICLRIAFQDPIIFEAIDQRITFRILTGHHQHTAPAPINQIIIFSNVKLAAGIRNVIINSHQKNISGPDKRRVSASPYLRNEIIFTEQQLCTTTQHQRRESTRLFSHLLANHLVTRAQAIVPHQTYRWRMNNHPAKYIAEAFRTTEVLEACIGV